MNVSIWYKKKAVILLFFIDIENSVGLLAELILDLSRRIRFMMMKPHNTNTEDHTIMKL